MLSIWQCKIGMPLKQEAVPKKFDAIARNMLEALYFGMIGKDADFTISSWDGTLTESERKVMHDRYPDTPEYQ